MSTPHEPRDDQALGLLTALSYQPDFHITIRQRDLWLIIAAIQLTYTHRQLSTFLLDQYWRIGHQLSQPFSNDPEITALMEKGWDRQHDVPSTEPQGSPPPAEIRRLQVFRPIPEPGQCGDCLALHPPEDPHNPESLQYQMAFQADHGRWPTWEDAIAHCTEEVKSQVRQVLAEYGIDPAT